MAFRRVVRPWGVRRILFSLGVAGLTTCGGSSGETPLHQDPEALRPMRTYCPGYAMTVAVFLAKGYLERAS